MISAQPMKPRPQAHLVALRLVIAWAASQVCVVVAASHRADLTLPDPGTAIAADQALPEAQAKRASAMAHYMLARQFQEQGQMRSALPHLKQAAELDPTETHLVARCAELVLQYEGRDAALGLLKANLAKCPDLPGSHFNLIRFLSTYVSEDPFTTDDCLSLVQDMLKRFPDRSDVLVFSVLHHLSMNQRNQAVTLLERSLRQDPGWTQAQPWMELARVAQEVWPLGQPEQLAEHAARMRPFYDRALKLADPGPKGDELRLEVARHLLLSNQLTEARQLCEQMLQHSGNLQAEKMLQQLLLSAGEKDRSLQLLEHIIEREPGNIELRRNLAETYEQRGDLTRAIPHLEVVIQRAGADPETYQTLGQWLLKTNQFRKAVDISRRCIGLYPQEPGFHLQASFAWSAQGRWTEALQHLKSAAAIAENGQPDLLNHRFYRHYGITLASAGQRQEAARMLEKSITLTPKDESDDAANSMNYLGFLYLEDNQHLAKAGELIAKANELAPEQAAYVDSLGWWHFKSGNPTQALTELQRAWSLLKPPTAADWEIVEHLATVCMALNRTDEARRWLTLGLALPKLDAEARIRLGKRLGRLEHR